jgi:glycosyltransferase involved in cell wall biosynthesis
MVNKENLSETLPTPIELVLLLQDLEFGGTQRYAIHLLKNLDRNLFNPHLWVLRGGTDMVPLAKEASAGNEVVWMSHDRWVGPKALANLAFRLRSHRPHVLYTMTVVPNIWGRLFGRMARVPVIVSTWRDLYPQQYERLMWRFSTRIITNAQALKDAHTRRFKVDPNRVSVVLNGVDSDFFTPEITQRAQEPTVLFVGRFARIKDPFTLLKAFLLTRERVPGAKLVLLGNGRLKPKIENFVRLHKLDGCVSLANGSRDPRSYFRQAWVFVLSSKREASPNAILEAMASELPIIAPRVGGIPELVQEGENGILFETGNAEALSEALIKLLVNDSQRLEMGRRSRERVLQRHSMERMVSETQQVIVDEVQRAFGACR